MTALCVVFPGQGSQSVRMLSDIAQTFPQVESIFAEASSVLDYDLWRLVQDGPVEKLDQTVHTQPALLAASYAIWCILRTQKKVQPTIMAGHSLGEYTALVCARALQFSDAIKLVAARGQYMQEAVPPGHGALAAIVGLDDATVATICTNAALGEILAAANFNSPGQVVIAGQTSAVERALVLAKEAGAKLAKQLAVSVPSHCALMKPAAEKLAKLLESITIQNPIIPVINNVDVAVYETAQAIKDGLVRQLFMPVRWVEIMQRIQQQGVTHLIECGPGKVLTGLNKRIVTDVQLTNTSDVVNLQNLLAIEV